MKWRQNLPCALFAAGLCLVGPWALPLGPIPITLATLGVYLAAGLLGAKKAAIAVGLYLLLGAFGAPVFSGFTGGAQQLLGFTGGFLIGYIVCAFLSGWLLTLCRKNRFIPLALLVGTLALYALGTLWYAVQTHTPIHTAVVLCVVPFLPGDAAKILVATTILIPLRSKRHVLHQSTTT